MRYADLEFELHGFVPAAEVEAERVRCGLPSRMPGDREMPVVIERAVARLPNGRCVSVLRGMRSAAAMADFETCRMFDYGEDTQPIKHRTVAGVQAELDAVAALPPLNR